MTIDNKIYTYVALLRGINVGGNNKVSMAQLKACLEKMGFADVTTYINSGNVIFKGGETDPRNLETKIETVLNDTFLFPIKVVVRDFEAIEKLIGQLPKDWETATDQRFNVMFLRHNIDNPKIMDQLNPKPGLEEVRYYPGVLLWSAKIKTLTRSDMLTLAGKKIYQDMTIRNQNTARKIYEIMKSLNKL